MEEGFPSHLDIVRAPSYCAPCRNPVDEAVPE